mmetsp:Transcript_148/g.89  ORF Transcript_148/g.89 Transcript_148/m.89 type:complete len:100 (-) Transcript_148:9-308(-)
MLSLQLENVRLATSTQTSGLTLRLQKSQDVALTDRTLHVPDERPASELRSCLVHKLHSHLNHTTTGTGAAQDFLHLRKLGSVGVHDITAAWRLSLTFRA